MHQGGMMILENLLDSKFPNATFHDSMLENLVLNYVERSAEFHFELYVGGPKDADPHAREKGVLTFKGFIFCTIESPDPRYDFKTAGGLWITSDGPIKELRNIELPKIIESLPDNVFAHYFFNNDWNAFIYIAFEEAEFKWI